MKRLSAALSRSAFEPVPVAFAQKIEFIIFGTRFRLLFFKVTFPVLNFLHLFICERCTDLTGSFEGDTGVITLASLPTGRAIVVQVETKTKVAAFLSSWFVFIRLVERHFKHNKRRTI